MMKQTILVVEFFREIDNDFENNIHGTLCYCRILYLSFLLNDSIHCTSFRHGSDFSYDVLQMASCRLGDSHIVAFNLLTIDLLCIHLVVFLLAPIFRQILSNLICLQANNEQKES
jgi:hypothetical protein